jgi:catechol 2,3-dioxygenase-like lactoylglutathione lyase family enzyme
MDWSLEVVLLPVADLDRAVAFYRDAVGFHLDHEVTNEHMHVVQMTPPGSGCSIVLGDLPEHRAMAPGSLRGLQLVVSDAARAHAELTERGVAPSGIRVLGDRDGSTFFGFSDPDGNTWSVQELRSRAAAPLLGAPRPPVGAVVREWRGWVATADRDAYVAYVAATGLAEYRATLGNLDARIETRDLDDGRTEVVTVSVWRDMDAVRAFAGDDPERAVFYPDDDRWLVDRDRHVSHRVLAG